MHKLRWEIAKILNRLVWFICPEPQKSRILKDWTKMGKFLEDNE